jgi:hypothetical protein
LSAEIPNPKFQVPNKSQSQNPKAPRRRFFKILDFEVCLGFGIWFLGFPRSGRGRPTIGTVESHYRSFSLIGAFLFSLANNWFAAA